MSILIAGLIIFFGIHSVSILNENWRDRMMARIGEGPWKGTYSLVAIIGFILIIWGYGLARQESATLFFAPNWLRYLAMSLLLPVFPLMLSTYLPGRIQRFARHPMLVATILWSFSHLLVNGQLADILLFGAFLLWAALDLYSMHRRTPRAVPGAPAARANDIIALTFGLALYGLFVVWLHASLVGIALIASIP